MLPTRDSGCKVTTFLLNNRKIACLNAPLLTLLTDYLILIMLSELPGSATSTLFPEGLRVCWVG